ncbi:NAD(P)H-binding protein [Streptomyces sp. B21-102]|uniref:NAD(P)H-binding protein n=1 Tax=unclassified Streptomyces TaxID=2593676 RepID=UPI003FA6FF8B
MIGSRLVAEALSRGHEVTAETRSGSAAALPEHPALTPLVLDASVPGKVAEAAAGHDAVVSALSPPRDGSDPTAQLLAVCRSDQTPTFARLIESTYRPDARCTVTSGERRPSSAPPVRRSRSRRWVSRFPRTVVAE